jgi:hypothetical protein
MLSDTRHAAIPQPGSNICVCGEVTTNDAVHNRIATAGSTQPRVLWRGVTIAGALPADTCSRIPVLGVPAGTRVAVIEDTEPADG